MGPAFVVCWRWRRELRSTDGLLLLELPKINPNAGRDHWSRVYSAVVIGGGIKGGQTIGASDAMASDPVTRAYYPADIGATIYSALGIDPASQVIDRLGRPHQLNAGEVIAPLYGSA